MAHAHPSWREDIDDAGLAANFDDSLSGLGVSIDTSTYNMSEALLALQEFRDDHVNKNGEALLALPVFKEEQQAALHEPSFQYVLSAATSPATKMNEETLTYLNQGQSYEIKLKMGNGQLVDGTKYLRSVVQVVFHERRLQYMEREQIETWKMQRPGERILDIDIPLSYGLMDVRCDSNIINAAEFVWEPSKDTGVYIRVHCISTEFTARKHGGEKGVPFRIQIDTYSHTDPPRHLHSASSQVKIFKPKGADRKNKTDREKMEKRSEAEKEKYQPSYECTVLTEIPAEMVMHSAYIDAYRDLQSIGCGSPTGSIKSANQSINSISDIQPRTPPTPASMVSSAPSPGPSDSGVQLEAEPLAPEATAKDVSRWLQNNRFSNYTRVFSNFGGADLLRLTRDDLIQICGLADGIRLNNALQLKAVRPRLTMFVCQESEQVYHAVYLESPLCIEMMDKLAQCFNIERSQIVDVYVQGPSGIHVLVTDEVVQNIQDQSRFAVQALKDDTSDRYRILLKLME